MPHRQNNKQGTRNRDVQNARKNEYNPIRRDSGVAAWFSKPANHDFTIYTTWEHSEIAQLIKLISGVIGIPEESIVKGESWQDHCGTCKNAESQSVQFRYQLMSHCHSATITGGNFPTKQAIVIYLRIPTH